MDKERIEQNKEEILTLLSRINRDGAKIEELINFLVTSDFFYAPASTKFHSACEGGLAEHSLNVYYNLKHLLLYKQIEIDETSVIICSLLHDISKVNTYERCSYNKKIYSINGTKSDELGRFDWVSKFGYKQRDDTEKFLFNNHEITSEYMIRQYIPLNMEESIAIMHHMGGLGLDSAKDNTSLIFARNPLACLLHLADMMATFVDEEYE